jgi:hypothetical protein
MTNTFQKTYFVVRLCNDPFSSDDQLELPIHHSHELVRRVDKIIPLSAGWVGEHITGVAPPTPVSSHLVTVERHWEFLTGEIRH